MYWQAKVILGLFILVVAGGLLYGFRSQLSKFRLLTEANDRITIPEHKLIFKKIRSLGTDSDDSANLTADEDQPPPSYIRKLKRAQALFRNDDLVNARKITENILIDPKLREYGKHWAETVELLSEINTIFLFTDAPCPEKAAYTVQRGDNLVKIANMFNTTVSMIQKSNNLDETNPLIYPNQVFRLYQGEWNIKVIKSKYLLLLQDRDRIVKIYHIGIGRQDRTPVGTFEIDLKDYEPDWWQPGRIVKFGDPDNVLGTRWLGLKAVEGTDPSYKGYGIHGTWQPETIGHAASQGCVRMVNADVDQLYDIVPLATRVAIEN